MRVYILGVPYEVERGYVIGKDLGSIDHVRQFITIDDDLEYDSVVETLMHEIMHGIEYAFNMDLDDRVIDSLSRGLYSVLVDPQNDAFWAAIAGSDEIMEDKIDVDCNAPEELEGHCPCCYNGWDYCVCGDLEAPVKREDSEQRAFNEQVGALHDAECRPRWDDPEAESSRQRFADACRAAEGPIRRSTVTTTEDNLPRQNHRRAGDPYW